MSSRTVTPDKFARSVEDFLDAAGEACQESLDTGLHKGALHTAKEWRKAAPVSKSKGAEHQHYNKTIRTTCTTSKSSEPEYVVHSSKPGLPHLLEKGHATVGGGRVAPVVHIEPAAEEGFQLALDTIDGDLANRLAGID